MSLDNSAINIADIQADAEKLAEVPASASAFMIRKASEWIEIAKNKMIPRKLFQQFWYESEICFMFSDTNAGKSILAVQIANIIASGQSEAAAQKVLYFDFELSEKQFERRYCEVAKLADDQEFYQNHYEFPDNFLRIEINPDTEKPAEFETYTDWLNYSFEQAIVQTGTLILIVDNITYLRDEAEKSQVAIQLMQLLKRLKTKYGLSILVLGHTPKRDMSKPLGINDLGGSKMLANFCDSCFAVGKSFKDINLRYLKQIKSRNGEFIYDTENVFIAQVIKDYNFLEFQPIGFSSEKEHLKTLSDKDKDNLHAQISVLSYLPQREIAKRLGVSAMTVNRHLKKAESVGKPDE